MDTYRKSLWENEEEWRRHWHKMTHPGGNINE
jgi:hypothetical protein